MLSVDGEVLGGVQGAVGKSTKTLHTGGIVGVTLGSIVLAAGVVGFLVWRNKYGSQNLLHFFII